MTKKLCDFFKQKTEESKKRSGFDINKEVHLGSTLYSFLKYYDQLLLPILVNLRDENQTTEGKEFIKVFDPRKDAFIKGGRRTKRHKKRSGNKRSGNKRSGNKRSGNKRSGKRSGHKSRRR